MRSKTIAYAASRYAATRWAGHSSSTISSGTTAPHLLPQRRQRCFFGRSVYAIRIAEMGRPHSFADCEKHRVSHALDRERELQRIATQGVAIQTRGNVMNNADYGLLRKSSVSSVQAIAAGLLVSALGFALPALARDDDSHAGSKPLSCAELAQLRLPNTKITSTQVIPAGPFANASVGDPLAPQGTTSPLPTCSSNIVATTLPTFCRITAAVTTPGASEPISIDLWMPLDGWNGKFEGVGNHGFAGEIEYADMGPELNKGYAVATTDTGHAGASATAWMQNHQQIVNYGSLGIHEMTVKSKAIIQAFYAKKPKFSYFNGCSTGGKEGLMEAQRYPDDYDGINIGG